MFLLEEGPDHGVLILCAAFGFPCVPGLFDGFFGESLSVEVLVYSPTGAGGFVGCDVVFGVAEVIDIVVRGYIGDGLVYDFRGI